MAVGSSLRWAATLAVLCSLAFPGMAQTPTRDEPFPRVPEGRRWGPFLVDLGFTIDNIGYDDNLFLVDDDDPDRPKETDYVIRMGPEIHAQTNFGQRVALTVKDKLQGEVYLSHSNLNHADNNLDLQLDALLGPALLTSKGKWSTSQSRPSSEIDERTRRDLTELGETMRLFLGAKTDIAFTLQIGKLRYEDEDSLYLRDIDGDGTGERVSIGTALDRDRTRAYGEIGWRPRGKTRFFARYRFQDDDFVHLDTSDAEEQRVTIGAEFRPSAYINGKIEFGWSELEATAEGSQRVPYDGTVSETEVTYRPTSSSRITAIYEKDVRFSTWDVNLFYEEVHQGLRFETYLGTAWGIQAGFSRRDLDYPEPDTLTAPDPSSEDRQPRADTIDDVYGGILLRMRGGLNLGIRIGRRERTSTIQFANDTQTYVQTTGSFQF